MSDWVSDYTPNIDAMRSTYKETWFYAPHTNSEKEKNAEFDRFLELVKLEERSRIIKLLKTLEAVGSDPTTFDYYSTADLIALIEANYGESATIEREPND
jgi:hypothetical protein